MATKYDQYLAGEISADELFSDTSTTPTATMTTNDLDRPDFFEVFQQNQDGLSR